MTWGIVGGFVADDTGEVAQMASMQAFRIAEWGEPPRFHDVPVPEPGPGQVLVRVAASGLCRADLRLVDGPPDPWSRAPFTLGHESTGRVAVLGPGVEHLAVGDGVVVSGVLFCGSCDRCVRGRQDECRTLVTAGSGAGDDGGLAEYLLAEVRHVVPLGTLDPVAAAPLADAGATAYHVVRGAAPLLAPGATAVVVGMGAAGGFAVQYLRQFTGARIIALDPREARLADARRLGADDAFPADGDAAALVRELTGTGAEAVLDFVGSTSTLEISVGALGNGGRVLVAGEDGGMVPLGWERLPVNGGLVGSSGFTPGDLRQVVALAATGRLELLATAYPFHQVAECLDALREDSVAGAAVITLE